VVRGGLERLLRSSLDSEAGLQVGILDNAYTLRIGADASKSEESLGEDLIRTFEVDVKGANVVHWRSLRLPLQPMCVSLARVVIFRLACPPIPALVSSPSPWLLFTFLPYLPLGTTMTRRSPPRCAR